ncbi:hypothetical protein [Streptomyces alanosinicus]|uniref:hypothetical protein n=1 Tax=Streptomyces alanosinicus TaxID=68171 RepID=UPI0016722834|nr:hypothetical protein [Streptomyces alanosinicus]
MADRRAPAEQREWWTVTAGRVTDLDDSVPLSATTASSAEAQAGPRTCVDIHLARGTWQRKPLPWIRLYRAHAAPDATS